MLFHAVGFGLVTAGVVALAAVGLALQVSVTNFVNFAYGDFMTFGAYIAYTVNSHGVSMLVAVAAGAVATGLLGIVCNQLIFRPMSRGRGMFIALLIATIGLSFVVQNAITLIWGPGAHRYRVNGGSAHAVGPFLWTANDIAIMVTAFVLLLALHLMLKYTKFGKMQRATSNNADLAQASGVDTGRIVTLTWFLAGLFAAAGGVGLVLEVGALRPTVGFNEVFVIFSAVVVGGIGRPYGAMLGALLIGLLSELFAAYGNPAYSGSIAFAVVVIVLLVRPQGIFAVTGKAQ